MTNRPLIEVTGFAELQRKIKELGDDKKKKSEIIKVLRKVAQGTVTVAKRNAPISKKPHIVSGKRTKKTIQPGNLKKSIGVITARRSADPTVVVGPRAKGQNDGWYGNMVELGHNVYRTGFKRKHSSSAKARAHNSSGATNTVPGKFYMKKTYEQTKGQVTPETAQSVATYIQKQIDRLSR